MGVPLGKVFVAVMGRDSVFGSVLVMGGVLVVVSVLVIRAESVIVSESVIALVLVSVGVTTLNWHRFPVCPLLHVHIQLVELSMYDSVLAAMQKSSHV